VHLGDQKYVSVVSFRADGSQVATPLWVARAGDALEILTWRTTHKVGRLRGNPAVTVAPCTLRGKVLDEPVSGRAELLPLDETSRVRELIRKKYGFLGWLVTRRAKRREDETIAARITLDRC
jgi:PPOX class probable F420-dependent enzyme